MSKDEVCTRERSFLSALASLCSLHRVSLSVSDGEVVAQNTQGVGWCAVLQGVERGKLVGARAYGEGWKVTLGPQAEVIAVDQMTEED